MKPKLKSPTPMLKEDVRHGFDGEPPVFVAPRDFAGQGKRRLDGIENINTDRLGWLESRGRIERYHLDAGRRLEADNQLALIGGFQTLQGGNGGHGVTRLSEAKCDALDRVNAVQRALTPRMYRILELVVFEGLAVGIVEKRLLIRRDAGTEILKEALECLARHYGLVG